MSRYCAQCGRAKKACICSTIQILNTNTQLIILQHPTEVKRAKGTAKILSLSLPNSVCFVGEDFSHHEKLNQLLQQPDYKNVLLYPKSGAKNLREIASSASNDQKIRLILIDGTWKKAYKIYQLSLNLQSLAAYVLPTDLVGNYIIRKAPSSNSLSTVEAGYYALSMLEPTINFQPLLNSFDSMVEFYLQQVPKDQIKNNYS